MSIERVKLLIKKAKESIHLEYKESRNKLPSNLFETICAMLNREGGDIVLGVDDRGKITGVEDGKVDLLKTNLVNLSNNDEKINPVSILFPISYQIDGKWVIHIPVPSSSQVHKLKGLVYDRSEDGDYKVTDSQSIGKLYAQKQLQFTEGKIFPFVTINDFKADLFDKARNMMKSYKPNHPWLQLSNEELLLKAGLWKRDVKTNEEGYTLAAILLFGKDKIIRSAIPAYKIDLLVRKENVDRYDDRDTIKTNLIDAFDRIMAFIEKHLPDKFYMEGTQRMSLRSKIFREIASNIIIHREYGDASPTTLTIFKDKVETHNANIPNGNGLILPKGFTPRPKNPDIAHFYQQIGRAEELGSGVTNVHKYLEVYMPNKTPKFIEGDVFKTIIPLASNNEFAGADEGTIAGAIAGAIAGVTEGVKDRLVEILQSIANDEGKRTQNYSKATQIKASSMDRYMRMLREASLIEFKGATNVGGYYLTDLIKQKIARPLTNEYELIPILGQLRSNQMFKVALKDGTEISGGFIGHKNGEIIYYTMKGIGKMFKPNMSKNEQNEAEQLKNAWDGFLVENKLVSTISIDDIDQVLI